MLDAIIFTGTVMAGTAALKSCFRKLALSERKKK